MELSAEEIQRNQDAQYFKGKVFEYPSVAVLELPKIEENWTAYFGSGTSSPTFKLRVASQTGELPAIVEARLFCDNPGGDIDAGQLTFQFKPLKDRRKNAKKDLTGIYKLEFLNPQGTPFATIESGKHNWLNPPNSYPFEMEDITFRELFLSRTAVLEHLEPGDSLTVRLTFTEHVSQIFEYPNEYRLHEALEEQENVIMCKEMSELLGNGMDADVTIKTNDGGTLQAHKLILKSRVPAFRAMLETDMKEKDGLINLPISYGALKIILWYIYTGKLHDDWKEWKGSINEVLDSAKQYELEGMLRYYDKMLISLCNDIDAGDLLCLAQKYELKQAEADITKWINSGNVMVE